ncbi:CU044_2847 family protein [Streptomyces rishiriensis]|uniref:CU044_2847 family protein n=1 Tax=Streptomyces rishiriensis TaxID=68264 RepID=UPI0037B6C493
MSGDDVTRVARIALPDGTPVWARISGAGELSAPAGRLSYSDTGFAERVEASVESLHALVTGVARSLAEPLRAVRPDEVSVEFGIELTAKAGKVVGLLADGEAKAGITVTLTWNGGPPDPDAPPAATGAPTATGAPAAAGARAGTGARPSDDATAPAAGTRARADAPPGRIPAPATAPGAGPADPVPSGPQMPYPPHPPRPPHAPDAHPGAASRAGDGAAADSDGAPRAGASPGAPMHGGGDGPVGGGGA